MCEAAHQQHLPFIMSLLDRIHLPSRKMNSLETVTVNPTETSYSVY